MIKSILVATDGSNSANKAMELALELASRSHASIEGLSVIQAPLSYSPIPTMEPNAAAYITPELIEIRAQMREEAEKTLAELSARCEAREVPFTGKIKEGKIPETICAVARTVDIIAMGKHGLTPEEARQDIGSVLASVIRNAVRPVIVVPESYETIECAIVAYDRSRQASHALIVATDLVNLYNIPLWVLTVSDSVQEREAINAEAMEYLSHYSIQATPMFASFAVFKSRKEI